MKQIKELTTLLAICFLGTGCAARINKVMASWEGHNANDLIARWGPPQQTFSDGSGGTVFVYSATRSYTTPGQATTQTTGSATASGNTVYGQATSQTVYTPAQTSGWTAYRMFWVNSQGTIYRWAWRGL